MMCIVREVKQAGMLSLAQGEWGPELGRHYIVFIGWEPFQMTLSVISPAYSSTLGLTGATPEGSHVPLLVYPLALPSL